MDIKDCIEKRVSVRQFDDTFIPDFDLNEIVNNLLVYYDNKVDCEFITRENFLNSYSRLFDLKAPYYLKLSAANYKEALFDLGLAGETAVLRFTSKNVLTCWYGGAQQKDGENYSIFIAFGKNSKENVRKRNHKTASELSINSIPSLHLKGGIAVALAPSAMNLQPVRLYYKENIVQIFRKKQLISPFIKEMQYIDCGIAAAHLQAVGYEPLKNLLAVNNFSGMEYMAAYELNI